MGAGAGPTKLMGHSLLDLVAAVGASVADDELKLLTGIFYKLAFEGPLLGLGGPGQPLVDIKEAIEPEGEGDEAPAYRLPHLQRHSGQRHSPLPPTAHPLGKSSRCQEFCNSPIRRAFVFRLGTPLSTSLPIPLRPEGKDCL